VSATAGNITTASTSTIVQTVSRCMVARSCAIGTASTVCATPGRERAQREGLHPAGRGALPDADGHDARRHDEHVAALEPRLLARARRTAGGCPSKRGWCV
jgi:hypothetical protein